MRRSFWDNIDFAALFVWVCLVCIGLVAIYSSTKGPGSILLDPQMRENFYKQRDWFIVSGFFLVFIMSLPIWFFTRLAPVFYGLTILLIIITRLMNVKVNGAYAWFVLGPIRFQISEFAKVAGILMVAYIMARKHSSQFNLQQVGMALGVLIFPALLLILVQNDTGTGLVFLALVPIVLFWSGLDMRWMAIMVSTAVIGYVCIFNLYVAGAIAVAVTLIMHLREKNVRLTGVTAACTIGLVLVFGVLINTLQEHQLARIKAIADPDLYSSTVGYQTLRSMYTIGAGGLMGEGFMQGTQTQLAYVPEQSTDFVYTVISEEFGFFGSVLVLALYLILMYRLLFGLTNIQNPFAQYFGVCAVGMLFTHVIINIGMTTGVMPVIGIPLPFISYGGTALLANTALFGIAMNFMMRSNEFPPQGI